jgi:hypothetical protein
MLCILLFFNKPIAQAVNKCFRLDKSMELQRIDDGNWLIVAIYAVLWKCNQMKTMGKMHEHEQQ